MKKILIVVLLSLLSIVMISNTKEVEAFSGGLFPSPQTPKFTYLLNGDDEYNGMEIEFEQNVEYYDRPVNYTLELKQVFYNGRFIKTLDTVVTDFVRSPEILVDDNFTTFITSENDIKIIDLKTLFTGELVSLNSITYGDHTILTEDKYLLSTDKDIIYIYPSSTTITDTIFIDVTYVQGLTYTYTYTNDFSNIHFGNTSDEFEVEFYELSYNDVTVYSGAVMENEPPEDIITALGVGQHGVEVGKFFTEDSTPDLSDQTGFTYTRNDDYMIVYYEFFDTFIYGSQGIEFSYIFTDIQTNTTEYSFNSTDLLFYLGMSFNVLEALPDILLKGFIILDLEGEKYNALYTDVPSINDKALLHDFESGSYLLSTYDTDLTQLIDASEVVINIVDSYDIPFELEALYEDVVLEGNQVLYFSKLNNVMTNNYTTVEGVDPSINFNYATKINSVDTIYGITYKTIDELLTITPYWILEPVSLPYSLDTSDYAITVEAEYNIVETLDLEGKINNLITFSSFNSDLGRLFIALVTFLIVNIGIAMYPLIRSNITFIISNLALIFIFTSLGFIAIWVSLGVGTLLALMMLLIFNRSGGEGI